MNLGEYFQTQFSIVLKDTTEVFPTNSLMAYVAHSHGTD